jgi:tRNA pseudouridine13 synthase
MYELKRMPEDFIVTETPGFDICDGPYSYYLLEKTGQNTEDIILDLSQRYHIPRRMFSYAGSKDRRAVTSQYISVKGRIPDQDTKFRLKFIGTGKDPISLGGHRGNHFSIVVRNIMQKPQPISSTINYFDDQRFGRHNMQAGLAILKRDFKGAAAILDEPAVKAHLEDYPNDAVGALRKMPYKILNMYIHSVQSYIFNEAAATIVRRHDHKDTPYSQGTFAFPIEEVKDQTLSLVTFDSELTDEEDKILLRLGLKQRDFVLKEMPGITPEGGKRELNAKVDGMAISELIDDELNPGKKKVKVEFSLGRGSYATVVVRHLFLHER